MYMPDTITVKPWTIAVFTILSSITGAVIKDRMKITMTESTVVSRVEQLEKTVDHIQADAISRNEFIQYEKGVSEKVDSISDNLKDIKTDLKDLKRELHVR
jgi:hypothetical protein